MIGSLFGLSALCLLAIATAFLCRTPIGWINIKPALISRLARLGAKRFDPKNRADADKFTGMMLGTGKLAPDVSKSRVEIAVADNPVPCVLYTPSGPGPFPVFVWIHGGCWLLGRPDHGERELSYIAREANTLVVSVDYRLAPEYPYPAGLNDCFQVTSWLARHGGQFNGDPTRISVGGSSAGGNLATAVALRARDEGSVKLLCQILRVPVTDAIETDDWPSYREAGENYVLSRSAMEEAIQLYTPDKSARHQAWVSPLYAPSLAGLPTTLITTAHLDPLRDQGEAYAQRLRAQGVQVRLKRFPATTHDFIGSAKALRASSAMAVEMLRGVNTRERNASGDA